MATSIDEILKPFLYDTKEKLTEMNFWGTLQSADLTIGETTYTGMPNPNKKGKM